MRETDADVAVIGLGAMGSCALWRLAERGVDVLGIERFDLGNDQGSSHGHTRLFRVACLEHPGLVPIAKCSENLWRELEERTGDKLLDITGGVMIGPPDSPVIAGTLRAARDHDLPVSTLDAEQLRARYPQHAGIAATDSGVLDPLAGIVRPEQGVRAACRAAADAGARVLDSTRVTDVRPVDGGVRIATSTEDYLVRQAVVTTGPWLHEFAPHLGLQPLRTAMTWFAPRAGDSSFDISRLPVFIRQLDNGDRMWGHGAVDGIDPKVGPSETTGTHQEVHPDEMDRVAAPADWAKVSELVRRGLPGLDPVPSHATTCMTTRSHDGQFQLGRPGNDGRLVIGGGCSGHAFKHATGLGEAIAQLVCDEPAYTDLSFMDPERAA